MPWILTLPEKQMGNWLPLEVFFLCDTSYMTSCICFFCLFSVEICKTALPTPKKDPFIVFLLNVCCCAGF